MGMKLYRCEKCGNKVWASETAFVYCSKCGKIMSKKDKKSEDGLNQGIAVCRKKQKCR